MNKKSVNIIGAGPGGLAAGMLLVKEGFVVNIYEKNSKVGGRNGSIQLGDYIFDIGPTFLMMTESLEENFSLCNLNLHDYVKIKKLDPMYRLNFADGRELFPSSDSDKMCKQLEKFKPGSSKGYLKYLKKEKKKHDKLLPCLKAPYSGLKDYLRLRLISSLPYLDAHVSVYQVLQRYFKDPDVCTAFTFQAKYIGMSPWTAPGTFSIITFIEHEGGIYHVEGGLNKISAGMAKAFIEMGGKIHFKNEIESIEVEKRQYRSIKIKNKGEFSSDFLFINSDFAYTMSKLVEEKKRPHYTELKLKEKKI